MRYKLELRRMDATPDSTVSALWALDPQDDSVRIKHLGFIIEDGYRDVKVPGETRIPSGTYRLRKKKDGDFYTKYHSKYGHEWVPELVGVPGFTAILIHIGNYITNTRGCLLPNNSVHFNPGNQCYYGLDSANAYKALYGYLYSIWGPDDTVEIEIFR